MKDPKNIEALNVLVTYYITLHGLQGISLELSNPMAEYFTSVISNGFGMGGGMLMIYPGMQSRTYQSNVPSETLNPIIQKAYEFYQKIDQINIHPMMKEQVVHQLGDVNFDEFLNSSIDVFKKSFFQLLNNYKSESKEYNEIKLNILKNKMAEFVKLEDYENAALMRDKIKDIKELL